MKILLIDNETKNLDRLMILLKNHECEVISYKKIDLTHVERFDAIVLTGGSNIPVFGNDHAFRSEIDLIRNLRIPIFGICLGFELIAHAFGSKLKIHERKRGIKKIRVEKNDRLFSEVTEFFVFESHRWSIKEVASDLLVLAKSEDGIEVIKHKKWPIYGVQFHPEVIKNPRKINLLLNFLEIVGAVVFQKN